MSLGGRRYRRNHEDRWEPPWIYSLCPWAARVLPWRQIGICAKNAGLERGSHTRAKLNITLIKLLVKSIDPSIRVFSRRGSAPARMKMLIYIYQHMNIWKYTRNFIRVRSPPPAAMPYPRGRGEPDARWPRQTPKENARRCRPLAAEKRRALIRRERSARPGGCIYTYVYMPIWKSVLRRATLSLKRDWIDLLFVPAGCECQPVVEYDPEMLKLLCSCLRVDMHVAEPLAFLARAGQLIAIGRK